MCDYCKLSLTTCLNHNLISALHYGWNSRCLGSLSLQGQTRCMVDVSNFVLKLHVVLKGTRRIVWAVKCTRPLLLDRSSNMTLLQWINVLTEVVNLDNIPKLPCTKAAGVEHLCYFWLRFLLVGRIFKVL